MRKLLVLSTVALLLGASGVTAIAHELDPGFGTCTYSPTGHSLNGTSQQDTCYANGIDGLTVRLHGNADQYFGNDSDEIVYEGKGDDSAITYGGADVIHGGAGSDALIGGAGNDLLEDREVGGDHDSFLDGSGHDTIQGLDAVIDPGVDDTWYKCVDGQKDYPHLDDIADVTTTEPDSCIYG